MQETEDLRECRRCLLREAAQDGVYQDIQKQIARFSDSERTDKDLYQTRLHFCQTCDQLIAGVCMKCGCYVEWRAALKRMHCPNVRDRKW